MKRNYVSLPFFPCNLSCSPNPTTNSETTNLNFHEFFDWLHRVLGSCGFQWCSFHSCGVSKKSWNICLMQILCTNSLAHAFFHILWSLYSCGFGPYGFSQNQKMSEPRTRCLKWLQVCKLEYFSLKWIIKWVFLDCFLISFKKKLKEKVNKKKLE